jgi:hypothetical protein
MSLNATKCCSVPQRTQNLILSHNPPPRSLHKSFTLNNLNGGGGGSRNHLPKIPQLPNIQQLTDLQIFANFRIVTSSGTKRQIPAPKLIHLWYVIYNAYDVAPNT